MTERAETEDSENKVPIWQIRDTCYVSTDKQCSEGWARKRIGCIQASFISKVCGRTNFNYNKEIETPEELAEIICGLSSKSFNPYQLNLMDDGIRGEPVVKQWYSNQIIHRPITDIGVAVWKKNPYFRASLDGETTYVVKDETSKIINTYPAAVEVKIPERLNPVYIDVLQSWGRGNQNPHPSEYIFASHYDQMTAGGVITDKHGCYYIVACLRTKTCFHQYIETDFKHWNEVLYPKAEAFRLRYVVPLLEINDIEVIMPPGVIVPSTKRRTSVDSSIQSPVQGVTTSEESNSTSLSSSSFSSSFSSSPSFSSETSPIKPKIACKKYIHPLPQLNIHYTT